MDLVPVSVSLIRVTGGVACSWENSSKPRWQRNERYILLGDNFHGSLAFLHILQRETLTIFVPDYLSRNVYIANNLRRYQSKRCPCPLPIIEDSGSLRSKFLSFNALHCLCRYHLALCVVIWELELRTGTNAGTLATTIAVTNKLSLLQVGTGYLISLQVR